jgi:hypothetical protein
MYCWFPACFASLSCNFLIYTILTFDQKKKKSKKELSVERDALFLEGFPLSVAFCTSYAGLKFFLHCLFLARMAINKQFLVLHPSWIQRIQEGFRFNLIFFGTVLVSSPSTQASEVSISSNHSLSPTLRDSSGVGVVSLSSLVNDCLDGSGGDFFEGAEFISGVAFMTSATSTDAINGVFDLLAGVHGPGTFTPSA